MRKAFVLGNGRNAGKLETKKPVLPRRGNRLSIYPEMWRQVLSNLVGRPSSVSDDRATVSGDHHVCRVVTITETERQNLAAKNAGPATDQCWSCFGTAWWDARGDFIAAAGAGIFNAPRDWNRWGGRAAYGLAANGLAAIHGGTATTQQAEATRFCL